MVRLGERAGGETFILVAMGVFFFFGGLLWLVSFPRLRCIDSFGDFADIALSFFFIK